MQLGADQVHWSYQQSKKCLLFVAPELVLHIGVFQLNRQLTILRTDFQNDQARRKEVIERLMLLHPDRPALAEDADIDILEHMLASDEAAKAESDAQVEAAKAESEAEVDLTLAYHI